MEFDLEWVEELRVRDAELERFVFDERVFDERVELERDAEDDEVERCGREAVDEERDAEEEDDLDDEDDEERVDDDEDELERAGGVYVLFFVCACADAMISVAPRISEANLF